MGSQVRGVFRRRTTRRVARQVGLASTREASARGSTAYSVTLSFNFSPSPPGVQHLPNEQLQTASIHGEICGAMSDIYINS